MSTYTRYVIVSHFAPYIRYSSESTTLYFNNKTSRDVFVIISHRLDIFSETNVHLRVYHTMYTIIV